MQSVGDTSRVGQLQSWWSESERSLGLRVRLADVVRLETDEDDCTARKYATRRVRLKPARMQGWIAHKLSQISVSQRVSLSTDCILWSQKTQVAH